MDTAQLAGKLLAPFERDIVELAQALLRIDTVSCPPHGREENGQLFLASQLKNFGIDAEVYSTGFLASSDHPLVRKDRNYEGRPNLVARLNGSGGGKSLLFSGHMDTVSVGKAAWTSGSPFSGNMVGPQLYGRGAFDMKAALAAQFGVLIALQKSGLRLRGDVIAESVVDEEWAGGGGTLAARIKGISADACVIGEGTQLAIVRATRGGYFVDITLEAGSAADYFSKGESISPAVPMGRMLGWIEALAKQRKTIYRGSLYEGFADPAPVQVLALEANRFENDTPWAVPLVANVRVYFQFLPHEDMSAIIGEIRESFDVFCQADVFFREYPPRWTSLADPPLSGHELAEEHPWVDCLSRSFQSVLQRSPVVNGAEYPCDAFIMQNYFGIPTLLFGPCGGGAHNVDEFVNTESVISQARVLLSAAIEWCG